MNQRTVIKTGANSGIGKGAAGRFVNEGHQVIMACRNLVRSKPVRNEIEEISKNRNIFLEELDMASFDSIHAFCASYKSKYQNLDVLIHNALFQSRRRVSAEPGWN